MASKVWTVGTLVRNVANYQSPRGFLRWTDRIGRSARVRFERVVI